ncbi:hypothetical protein GCWU000325_01102 [Alloprevotella tannerae ATCC 51259]|uniref:Uncharacterized protein n=1 Tax=Alloprevotella tannerae ATCC 51259 TaxID=626522 RepID=C9LFW4_9BACT|nr:hypothetical protein GCWU000325_01102 [Alloprevotella tannerae ATCC 51259]
MCFVGKSTYFFKQTMQSRLKKYFYFLPSTPNEVKSPTKGQIQPAQLLQLSA